MSRHQDQNGSFKCEKVDCCPFFEGLNGNYDNLITRLKDQYCFKDNSYCARYYLNKIMGAQNVPVSMLPHQWEWVNQILKDASKYAAIRDPEDMRPPG